MMNSKISCFSLSGVLIKENIRRFWVLPAMGLLVGILGILLPLALSEENGMYLGGNYFEMVMSNQNPLCVFLWFLVPLCAGAYVLNYLQRSASVTSMHAMPFSRGRLFGSNVVSGYLMSALPIIVMALLMLLMMKPTYYDWVVNADGSLQKEAENLMTASGILYWMSESLIIALFSYACALIGGMVAGNSVMQGILAVVFNFISYAVALPIVYFEYITLFGCEINTDFLLKLHPMVYSMYCGDNPFGMKYIIGYIVISLLIIVLADFLYRKRALENTGDSITFNSFIVILGDLATICGAILGGLYFQFLGDGSEVYRWIGYAVGSVITFIIVRMILMKTPRIFNMRSLKNFGICIAIMLLIIGGFKADVLGISSKVPSAASVDKVIISGIGETTYDGYDRYGHYDVNRIYDKTGQVYYNATVFEDAENIATVCELHKAIVNDRKIIENANYSQELVNIAIVYNDGALKRNYNVPYTWLKENGLIAQLYESKEFKDNFSIKSLKAESFQNLYVTAETTGVEQWILKSETKEFLEVLDQDFAERTYEQESDARNDILAYVNMDYVKNLKNDEVWTSERGEVEKAYESICINIRESDKHTVKWLKDHGYDPVLTADYSDVGCADVYIDGEFAGIITSEDALRTIIGKAYKVYPKEVGYDVTLCNIDLYPKLAPGKHTQGDIQHAYDNGIISENMYNNLYGDAPYIRSTIFIAKEEIPEGALQMPSNNF